MRQNSNMKCSFCGNELENGAQVCSICGVRVGGGRYDMGSKPTPPTPERYYKEPVVGNAEDRKRYKRQILPFKITAGIVNLAAYGAFFFVMVMGMIIAYDEDNVLFGYGPEIANINFYFFAVISVVVFVASLVLSILGFVLPAKGGLIASVINSSLIIIAVLSGAIPMSVLNDRLSRIYTIIYKESDAYIIYIGFMTFAVASIVLCLISLVLSIAGLTRKKPLA